MTDFVSIQGDQWIYDGMPLRLRGMGVGSWLNLEHFMLGLPGWDGDLRHCLDSNSPGFMRHFTEHFFTLEDAVYLRSLGVNLIRVPVNYRLFWDDATDAYREEGFLRLAALASICEEAGLFFLPDMHTTPGGHNPDWHSECRTGTPEFWQYATFRRQIVALWREIARRLSHSPALLGYDLLNEPVLPDGNIALLNQFYADAVAAIREVDPHHILFLEGNHFSMDFRGVQLPKDANAAYTYHLYPAVWDARLQSLPPSERYSAIQGALTSVLATMEGYHGPLLCGETGYELSLLDLPLGLSLTRDTLSLLEAANSSWCLWCYKDTGFMGLVRPKADSGWRKLCDELRPDWDHHRAEALGYAAADFLSQSAREGLTEAERYRIQFIIRAALSAPDVRRWLAPALQRRGAAELAALPEDFLLSRCDRFAPLEALLRDFTGEK